MIRLTTAALATLGFASPALADTALGLIGDRTLVMIDTTTAAITGQVDVDGIERLHGIDWRAGTMQVIGVTDTQTIIAIDPMTGSSTVLSEMSAMMDIEDGATVIVDVNPAADRLRFMSGMTNHRVNMDTGEVTVDGSLNWEADDMNAGADLMVMATGYINNVGKPESTQMFNIDTGLSALLQQTAPNDGTNKTIGALGVVLEGPVAFDVGTTAEGVNTMWLGANGGLHTLDMATGMVSESWMIEGLDAPLRDLTIVPAM